MKKNRRRRAGMTLIEIMVVMVIMSAIAAAAGFAVVAQLKKSRRHDASVRARTIQSAVVAYMMEAPVECPDVDDLMKAEVLDKTKSQSDPWGNEYVIECEGNTVHVHSNAEDGQPGTEDDIGF